MTTAARAILTAFDALPPDQQHQVTVEILRRSEVGDLPEAAFDEMAAELFRTYEAEETAGGKPQPR